MKQPSICKQDMGDKYARHERDTNMRDMRGIHVEFGS